MDVLPIGSCKVRNGVRGYVGVIIPTTGLTERVERPRSSIHIPVVKGYVEQERDNVAAYRALDRIRHG